MLKLYVLQRNCGRNRCHDRDRVDLDLDREALQRQFAIGIGGLEDHFVVAAIGCDWIPSD